MKSTFVYVSYIKSTPEKLWKTLTTAQSLKKYWFGMDVQSEWKVGSHWQISFADGRLADSGEILESVPMKKLVIKWLNEWKPEMKAEGFSRCTFLIEEIDGVVKFTVTHEMDKEHSQFIEAVSGGWPMIISNIKSLLETGSVILNTIH